MSIKKSRLAATFGFIYHQQIIYPMEGLAVRSCIFLCALLCSFYVQAVEYLEVTRDSVRVREQPGLEGRSLTMLHRGHLVIRMEEKGEWTRIYFTGREEQVSEGWMHSRYLVNEKARMAKGASGELQLIDHGARLSCEKVIGSELVQGCDLHLRYSLAEHQALEFIRVSCNAELVARTRNNQVIPVPITQTQKHKVRMQGETYSMHVLMQADASYALEEVTLEGYRCKLAGG